MDIRIRTWASGFGTWHAEITETGVGNAKLRQTLASEALWAEISERDPHADRSRFHVEHTSRKSEHNKLTTTFVEAWSTEPAERS